MESLGAVIKKTEGIADITACFNFIDSLKLSDSDFRLIIGARCRTLGDSGAAYSRYGSKLISPEQQRNMIAAAESPAGYVS